MSLRETLERIRSSPVPLNERTAIARILEPILAELGWDPSGQEVLWEHPVGGGRVAGRVDIALQADGRIHALIEAKAPGANLSQHVSQILLYAFHEGVYICVLTDGLRWWLYLPREPGHHEDRRFTLLHLADDPVDQLCDDLNTFLGRESLVSGHAEQRARQVLQARQEAARLGEELPRIWQRMLDEPDDDLIELVGQRGYETLNLRPQREQIIATIRGRPIPRARGESTELVRDPAEPAPSPSSQLIAAPTETAPVQRRTQRPTAIRLWGERHRLRWKYETLTTVVAELHERHQSTFDQTVEQLNFSISRDREQVTGHRIKQIPSGHYLDVNLDLGNLHRRCVRLLLAFGHSESDLEYLYEG